MRPDAEDQKKTNRQNERELKKLKETTPFEKGDLGALIIAALTTILPFAVLLFLLLFFIPMLLLRFL